MPLTKKKSDFYASAEAQAIKAVLVHMDGDAAFNTPASYSADSASYANNSIPFVDKHMRYLQAHPNLDMQQYISNLRLMSRIK